MDAGSGIAPVIGIAHAGVGSPGNHGRERIGIDDSSRSNDAPSSVGSCFQRATAASQAAPLGRHWTAVEVVERGIVRRYEASARAAFDRHVANRHAAIHVEGANGGA